MEHKEKVTNNALRDRESEKEEIFKNKKNKKILKKGD